MNIIKIITPKIMAHAIKFTGGRLTIVRLGLALGLLVSAGESRANSSRPATRGFRNS